MAVDLKVFDLKLGLRMNVNKPTSGHALDTFARVAAKSDIEGAVWYYACVSFLVEGVDGAIKPVYEVNVAVATDHPVACRADYVELAEDVLKTAIESAIEDGFKQARDTVASIRSLSRL